MWKELLSLFKSDSLLETAWSEAFEMLEEAHAMIEKSMDVLRKHFDVDVRDEIRKQDKDINQRTVEVRRKVFFHLNGNQSNIDLGPGLLLLNVVIDIERIGDYAKNMTEMLLYRDASLNGHLFEEELVRIEQGVRCVFNTTKSCLSSFHDTDKATALDILKEFDWINKACRNCVERIIKGEDATLSPGDSASLVLYVTWQRRTNSHLRNILTVFVNPFDHVGFKPEQK